MPFYFKKWHRFSKIQVKLWLKFEMSWFVKSAKGMRGPEKSIGIAVGIFTQYVKTAKG